MGGTVCRSGAPHFRASFQMRETCVRRTSCDRIHEVTERFSWHLLLFSALPSVRCNACVAHGFKLLPKGRELNGVNMMKRALITQMPDRVAVHHVMSARTHALSAPFSKTAALRAARNNGEESIQ